MTTQYENNVINLSTDIEQAKSVIRSEVMRRGFMDSKFLARIFGNNWRTMSLEIAFQRIDRIIDNMSEQRILYVANCIWNYQMQIEIYEAYDFSRHFSIIKK